MNTDKNVLEIIKEMTNKIREATSGLSPINEKRYQYSKDECETIFNNVYNAVKEYTTKNKAEDAYEGLLISIADRFKVSPTGGSVSRQTDALSDAEKLYTDQAKFQELLDSAKDLIIFIEDKTDKIAGTTVSTATSEKQAVNEPNTNQVEPTTDTEETPPTE